MLVLSVVSLGLPSIADAAHMGDDAASTTMAHDCVCPPGHEMPASDDTAPCAMTLACMIHCTIAPMAMAVDVVGPVDAVQSQTVLFAEIVGTVHSSSYPPFRPPSI